VKKNKEEDMFLMQICKRQIKYKNSKNDLKILLHPKNNTTIGCMPVKMVHV
jgi:hypothetical protein